MSDADIYGNVHNLSLIRYAEDASVEWAWALREELGIHTYWGAAEVQASFTMPLPWTTDEVGLSLRPEKVGRASMTLATSVTSGRGQHALVRSRVIRFDAEGKRTALTAEERAWFSRYLLHEDQPAAGVPALSRG